MDDIIHITDTLAHRGPDDSGYELFNGCAFGHRRLSIVDLSTAGHQPMSNEDKSVWIVFNGEIYNQLELKQDLIDKQHVFKSSADTEVLLHGIEEYGRDFINKLNGMFAFAIWNNNTGELQLACDRFGKKPLYYYHCNGRLVFASELKAIVADKEFNKNIDFTALSDYLLYGYFPKEQTIYKHVKKLAPGHYLQYIQGRLLVKKYWDVDFTVNMIFNDMNEKEICNQIREQFLKSIKYRLMSDVPLGVFLSGGIDSSVITALLTQLMPSKQIKTFSIGFKEKSFDETNYSNSVANMFNTNHHHQSFTLKSMLDSLPDVIEKLDEPFADASILPTYVLSKFTRQHVTVALGGDGGDELFAGYDPFLANFLANRYRVMPKFINNKVILPIINKLPVSEKNMSFDFKLKNFLKHVYEQPVMRNILWMGAWKPEEKRLLFRDGITVSDTYNSEFGILDSELLTFFQKVYLPNDILFKIDRASMMVSLEARSPFLDVNFAEYVNSMPYNFKIKGLTRKYILKKAFKNILPDKILYRNKKGFGIPLTKWIKEDLKSEITKYFSQEHLKKQDIFKFDYVNTVFNEHLHGKKDNRAKIWALYMFQKWYERTQK